MNRLHDGVKCASEKVLFLFLDELKSKYGFSDVAWNGAKKMQAVFDVPPHRANELVRQWTAKNGGINGSCAPL